MHLIFWYSAHIFHCMIEMHLSSNHNSKRRKSRELCPRSRIIRVTMLLRRLYTHGRLRKPNRYAIPIIHLYTSMIVNRNWAPSCRYQIHLKHSRILLCAINTHPFQLFHNLVHVLQEVATIEQGSFIITTCISIMIFKQQTNNITIVDMENGNMKTVNKYILNVQDINMKITDTKNTDTRNIGRSLRVNTMTDTIFNTKSGACLLITTRDINTTINITIFYTDTITIDMRICSATIIWIKRVVIVSKYFL